MLHISFMLLLETSTIGNHVQHVHYLNRLT